MEIALLSDNHSYYDDELLPHLVDVQEIWHAGDIGSIESIAKLKELAPLVGVHGNIDDRDMRAEYPRDQLFEREGVQIFMTHIGGYPGRYNTRVRKILQAERPDIYICGHSHICKVMKDPELDLIHLNPGAYGNHGFHKFRTFLKFELTDGKLTNLRAVELGLRGKIK